MTLRFPSEKEFEAWQKERRASTVIKEAVQAVTKARRGMNKTEQRYWQRLEAQRLAGEIEQYWYECVKLRLADRCWYTPDFLVIRPGKRYEFHEIKGGYIWEDARIKFKIAKEQHSWAEFQMWQLKKGIWQQIG